MKIPELPTNFRFRLKNIQTATFDGEPIIMATVDLQETGGFFGWKWRVDCNVSGSPESFETEVFNTMEYPKRNHTTQIQRTDTPNNVYDLAKQINKT